MRGRLVLVESESRGIGNGTDVCRLMLDAGPSTAPIAIVALPLAVTVGEIKACVPPVAGWLILARGKHRAEPIEDIPASDVLNCAAVTDCRAAVLEANGALAHLMDHIAAGGPINVCFVADPSIDVPGVVVRGLAVEAGQLAADDVPTGSLADRT